MLHIRRLLTVLNLQTRRRLIVAFSLFLVPAFLFVQLADEVREQETLPFDEAVLYAVNSVSSPFLDALAIGLTQLGGVIGVLVITAGLSLLFWVRAKHRSAVLLAVSVGGSVLLNVLLQSVFQRDRPELWERLVTENSYSFPSGHAMASSALAISIMILFWSTKWRWWAIAGACVYMVAIALTRMYLGVHYPTDIIAGWMVSAAWVSLVFVIANRPRTIRDDSV